MCFCGSPSFVQCFTTYRRFHKCCSILVFTTPWGGGRNCWCFLQFANGDWRCLRCREVPWLFHSKTARDCWSQCTHPLPTPVVFPLTTLPLPGNQCGFHSELSNCPFKNCTICLDIALSSFINRKRKSSTLHFPWDLFKRPLILQVIFYFWPDGINSQSVPDGTMFICSQLKLLLLLSGLFQVHVQKLLSCPVIGLSVSRGEWIMLK